MSTKRRCVQCGVADGNENWASICDPGEQRSACGCIWNARARFLSVRQRQTTAESKGIVKKNPTRWPMTLLGEMPAKGRQHQKDAAPATKRKRFRLVMSAAEVAAVLGDSGLEWLS
jgi:hypothetical protein